MRRALSVSALKRARFPRTSAAASSPADMAKQPERYVLSRRQALTLAGTVSLASAPMASALESALNATFTVSKKGDRIVFFVAGIPRWIIDPNMFDGSPGVEFVQDADGIRLSLHGAFYPGTNIPADISAVISRGIRPVLSLTVTKLNASFNTPFVSWLLQRENAFADCRFTSDWTAGDASIICQITECTLFPSWTLSLTCVSEARLPEVSAALPSGNVHIRLLAENDSTLLVPAAKRRTLVKIHRGANAWHVPLRVADSEAWRVAAADTAFNSCSIEAAGDARTCLLFEAQDGVGIRLRHYETTIGLRDVRYALARNKQGLHEALVARYSGQPTWMIVDGVSLEIGDRDGIAPFEMERHNGKLVRCIVAPALLRYAIPVDGAITEPSRTHPRTQIALIPPDVSSGALPKPHIYLAALQLDLSKSMQISSQGVVSGQSEAKSNFRIKQDPNILAKFKFVSPGNPKVSVIRPDDLMVLTFEFDGITINKSGGTFTAGGNGRLIVHFQPQHIAERAFFYVNDPDKPPSVADAPASSGKSNSSNEPRLEPPIDAVLAHSSRLVLSVPPGYSGQYSSEGLLDWSKFTLKVSPSAKPPEPKYTFDALGQSFITKFSGTSLIQKNSKPALTTKSPYKTSTGTDYALHSGIMSRVSPAQKSEITQYQGNPDYAAALPSSVVNSYISALEGNPPIRIPLDNETAIEYPYRLILSPNKYAAWAHATSAKRDENGRSELWHSRLGVRHSDGTVDENAAYFRTMRAIWSPDVGTNYNMSAKFKERPFRTSINRRDRHEIVQLTSNYGMAKTDDAPIEVKRFMLTSLGAWADMVGVWDPDGVDQLDVEQWIQRGTQGRDHFVRICYKGYLFPFGNRATLVKETERKFRRTPRGEMAAYLMQRMYIILREPVREFPAAGLAGMQYQGREFPFRRITITTKSTPNLRLPSMTQLSGLSSNSFWPQFELDGSGLDVMWSCIARDWDNKDHNFSTPLAFIANTDATDPSNPNLGPWITNQYEPENKEVARKKIPMNGQKIAFAPSIKLGDTSLPTGTFVVSGYHAPDAKASTPRFFPKMFKSTVAIEKVNELLGTNAEQDISFFSKYLEWAFEKGPDTAKGAAVNPADIKNPSQIFARLLNTVGMNFNAQSDKAGGLAAPSINIGGLSRLMGPIPGDFRPEKIAETAMAVGNFDPMQYFEDILNSKILGDITLKDVLDFVTGIMNNLDKMPGLDKKDDFGVSDDIKGAVSKSDIASAIQSIIDKNDAIKTAAQKVNDVVSADPDVKDAKDKLEAIINDVKSEMQQARNDITSEVANAKKALDNQLREWKKKVDDKVNELKSEVDKVVGPLKEAGNEAYKKYEEITGALESLKKGLQLVYEWQTEIKSSPGNILVPKYPGTSDKSKKAILYLKAEFKKKLNLDPPEVLLYGSISNFIVNLIGDGAAQFLIIKFNRIAISAKVGEKPSIDPDFESVEFAGPLTFVNKLKDLIPSGGGSGGVGFSFDFDVLPAGITASLTITLPNITVGVFSLMNLSFLMRVTVPFDGRPFSAYFAFCTRENPFRLTVMVFGGGGFFGIEITPKGVRMLEAAFEFGGNFAFDVGVASGGASVMAGIYFKLETKEVDGKQVEQSELTGYFRLTGNLSILGLIRVSLLFELRLTWQSNGKVYGVATIQVQIEILFLSFSVGVTVERQLKGSDSDPTFLDQLPQPSLWKDYCNAFA